MSNQCIISVSFDGQPEVQYMPLEFTEPGLGLSADGITWCEQSDALLYIDSHDELMMKRQSHAHIELERNGRKYVFQNDHPMRILAKDIIKIGDVSTHTFEILHIYRSKNHSTKVSRLSKLAMIACATSMVMTCNIACNRPTPNNATDAVQSSEPPTSLNATEDSGPSESELIEEGTQTLQFQMTHTAGILPQESMQLMDDRDDFYDEIKSDADAQSTGTD